MKYYWFTRMALVCMAVIGLLLCSSLCQAAVIRVALDGTTPPYDGASWATAYTSIQSAINAASSGDEIRVKGYTDSTTYDAGFSMVAGVSVKGGYTGAVDPVTGEDIRDTANYISTVTPGVGITDCVVYVPSTVTSQSLLGGFPAACGVERPKVNTGKYPAACGGDALFSPGWIPRRLRRRIAV